MGEREGFMWPYIATVLITTIVFGVIAIIFAPKIVAGANAQQIAKGHATKSKDEVRGEIKIVRFVISALILACLATLIVKFLLVF